jgi:hypothetical protein
MPELNRTSKKNGCNAKPQKGGNEKKPNEQDLTKMMGGSMTKKQSSKSSKKSKKSKCSKPLAEGYACCMHCRKNVKILSSVIKKTKNGRNQMVGKAECGHTVYRFVKG